MSAIWVISVLAITAIILVVLAAMTRPGNRDDP
jgi:hypothetical protein